jgi:hypothetical protein
VDRLHRSKMNENLIGKPWSVEEVGLVACALEDDHLTVGQQLVGTLTVRNWNQWVAITPNNKNAAVTENG